MQGLLLLLDFPTLWQMLRGRWSLLTLPKISPRWGGLWFVSLISHSWESFVAIPSRQEESWAVSSSGFCCVPWRLFIFPSDFKADMVKPSIQVDVKCFPDISFTRWLSETNTNYEIMTTSTSHKSLCYIFITSSHQKTFEKCIAILILRKLNKENWII